MKSLGAGVGLVSLLASMAYAASGETISGTVKDPSSAPYKGAFVRLQSAANNKITISVLSDKQGRYRFENLSPGGYSMWVSATGYKSDPPASLS